MIEENIIFIYKDIILLTASSINLLFDKTGVKHENRSADAVADLAKTLLNKFDYNALITSSVPEDIEALKTLSGWKTD